MAPCVVASQSVKMGVKIACAKKADLQKHATRLPSAGVLRVKKSLGIHDSVLGV